MSRKYPNVKEGKLSHEGRTYDQPDSDEQYVMVIELGNLVSVDPLYEVWVWQGIAAVVPNDHLGVME